APSPHPAAHDLAPGRVDPGPPRAAVRSRRRELLPRTPGPRGDPRRQAGGRGLPPERRAPAPDGARRRALAGTPGRVARRLQRPIGFFLDGPGAPAVPTVSAALPIASWMVPPASLVSRRGRPHDHESVGHPPTASRRIRAAVARRVGSGPLESRYKEPEIACQITLRGARDHSEGAFALPRECRLQAAKSLTSGEMEVIWNGRTPVGSA